MLISFRNSIVFEFTLFLPRNFFSVFGLELSKNMCLELARLVQSVKRYFTDSAWL